MDDGRLLGARSDGGVLIRPPNYEKFARVERVVISVPYYRERAYWDFLKAQIGKPYDKLASRRSRSIATGARRMRGLRRADSGWARTG